MTDYQKLQNQYEFNIYPKRDVTIVKGKDALLWDENGRQYIDCVAGIGVANIGHANEKVADAIAKQAKKLITCPGIFYNDVKAKALEKIVGVTPDNLTKAFLCNSGTEAVEAAIKFTRFTTKKTDFICAMRSYHGRTLGALSATYRKEYREEFQPLSPGFSFAPFNKIEKLEELVSDSTAGIMLEPVQGEGGINVGEKEFFEKVRKLCDDKGLILIIDEVQTGFCRTGKMLAIEHFDIQPDIMCLAKGIAGGIPLGAVVCSDKITPPTGKHGSTFGGNPVSCAATIAAIEFMEENDLASQAKEKGDYFLEQFQKHELKKVRKIKALGLMIGLELKEKVQPYILELLGKGVLVLPAGSTVIRVLPPLTISYEEIDTVVEKLIEVLQ